MTNKIIEKYYKKNPDNDLDNIGKLSLSFYGNDLDLNNKEANCIIDIFNLDKAKTKSGLLKALKKITEVLSTCNFDWCQEAIYRNLESILIIFLKKKNKIMGKILLEKSYVNELLWNLIQIKWEKDKIAGTAVINNLLSTKVHLPELFKIKINNKVYFIKDFIKEFLNKNYIKQIREDEVKNQKLEEFLEKNKEKYNFLMK